MKKPQFEAAIKSRAIAETINPVLPIEKKKSLLQGYSNYTHISKRNVFDAVHVVAEIRRSHGGSSPVQMIGKRGYCWSCKSHKYVIGQYLTVSTEPSLLSPICLSCGRIHNSGSPQEKKQFVARCRKNLMVAYPDLRMEVAA